MYSFLIRRLSPWFVFYISVEFLTFFYMLIGNRSHLDWGLISIVKTTGVLLLTSIVSFLYIAIPYVIYLSLMPKKIQNGNWDKVCTVFLYALFVSSTLFEETSSIIFWDEFTAAFNFIAVDYLVYTHEVLSNIYQSYPVVWFILGIVTVTIFIIWATIGFLFTKLPLPSFGRRLFHLMIYAVICILAFVNIDISKLEINNNRYNNELSKEGSYSLFSAFLKNEIPYNDFYLTHDKQKNLKILQQHLSSDNTEFLFPEENVVRKISSSKTEKKANVIVVLMESMGSSFLNENRGESQRQITPNLSRLSKEGIFFSKAYATGTRSVRGIEAVTLSVPPIPGQSIIRRPGNENLLTIGSVFKNKGYETKWIYGGYGYFDNMNYFFKHNGFQVVDRTEWNKGDVTFANAWGAADEDTFRKTIEEADKSYTKGKPFFNVLLTISNHRPYTYPEGRINLPSGKSKREGAVMYADYAIGKFIKDAEKKPWFDNTVFIFIADHTAGAAGNEEISIADYHIPAIIYAPEIFKPKRVDITVSQIDIMPTVFALLNFEYKSGFYGQNVLSETYQPRFFVSNYQKLGFVKNSIEIILKPVKQFSYTVNKNANRQNILDEAVAYYQQASGWWNKMKDNR